MSRPRARRAVGVGLLLPGLLLANAPAAPAQTKPAKPVKSALRPEPPPSPAPRGGEGRVRGEAGTCVHVVRRGDSVSRIAARYRVPRAAVVSANRLTDPDGLRLGQRLAVPGCRPGAASRGGAPRGGDPGDGGPVVKRVGPRRVLTRLILTEPEWGRGAIDLTWPVAGAVISGFGRRGGGWHAGVDIGAEMGAPVHASAPGTVSFSGWLRSYGLVVQIQHASGFTTLYAHNLKNLVEAGLDVRAGQIIAQVGRSGHATVPHVHFEVRRDGQAYNPLHLLQASPRRVLALDVVAAAGSLDDPPSDAP